MSWKNLPYWLKGGILIFPITILLTMVAGLISQNFYGDSYGFLFLLPFVITDMISKFFGISLGGNILLIASFLLYFFIGSLIGGIVGKFKSKKVE